MQKLLTTTLIAMMFTSPISMAGNEKTSKQILINGDSEQVHILVEETNGKRIEISLDLDESTAGVISQEIVNSLREKGLVTEKSNDSFSIDVDNLDQLAELEELEGLDILSTLKLLKGLEALQQLESLSNLDNGKIFL